MAMNVIGSFFRQLSNKDRNLNILTCYFCLSVLINHLGQGLIKIVSSKEEYNLVLHFDTK